jgi:hypothetical protein
LGNIIEKDNGTILEFTIKDDNGIVNLTSVKSVLFRLKKSSNTYIEKGCIVTDAENGKVELTLSNTDTSTSGRFSYQITVAFLDNSEFTSDSYILEVGRKL